MLCVKRTIWGIGERNEGNADNKGGNMRNEIGMQVRRINERIQGI